MASSNQAKLKMMTNQHPLTEEMMDKIHGDDPGYSNPYDEDDMRTAYDLGRDGQLKQVMEWLKDHLDVMSYVWADDVTAWGIDVESVIVDLKKAMRPAQEGN